jgi:hypothetical protein
MVVDLHDEEQVELHQHCGPDRDGTLPWVSAKAGRLPQKRLHTGMLTPLNPILTRCHTIARGCPGMKTGPSRLSGAHPPALPCVSNG